MRKAENMAVRCKPRRHHIVIVAWPSFACCWKRVRTSMHTGGSMAARCRLHRRSRKMPLFSYCSNMEQTLSVQKQELAVPEAALSGRFGAISRGTLARECIRKYAITRAETVCPIAASYIYIHIMDMLKYNSLTQQHYVVMPLTHGMSNRIAVDVATVASTKH
jgi:hypothetical protein